MSNKDFGVDLKKIMPGYNWVIRKSKSTGRQKATGTQSVGFARRTSSLQVSRHEDCGVVTYRAKSSLHEHRDMTLQRALEGLQTHHETATGGHRAHADLLLGHRKKRIGWVLLGSALAALLIGALMMRGAA